MQRPLWIQRSPRGRWILWRFDPFHFQTEQACLDLASNPPTKQVCGSVFNHVRRVLLGVALPDLDLLPVILSSGVGSIEAGLISGCESWTSRLVEIWRFVSSRCDLKLYLPLMLQFVSYYIFLRAHLFVCLFVCLFVWLFVCLFVCAYDSTVCLRWHCFVPAYGKILVSCGHEQPNRQAQVARVAESRGGKVDRESSSTSFLGAGLGPSVSTWGFPGNPRFSRVPGPVN